MSTNFTIGDLVTLDEQAEFRNDVQLADYDNPVRNLGLLRAYLFSNAAPEQATASVKTKAATGLLRDIADRFADEKVKQNRIVTIADYGHGKSHLALAIANYFAKPLKSEEVQLILDKLANAIDDPAEANHYRTLKETKGTFLVIRLRGDRLESIYTQFFAGLQRALQEYPATRDDKLPFWYEEADRVLSGLNTDQIEAADAYLKNHQNNVGSLLRQIRQNQDVYDLAVGAIHAATNVRPDLNQVSLSKAIEWTVGHYVGQGKPFGGILVLFDEFTLYILKHADRNAAGELQDLLNGVEDNPGKVVFMGFAQDDPFNIADSVAMGGAARSNLKKELNRIDLKYRLYSLMESVIGAYLVQAEPVWQQALKDRRFGSWIYNATDIAYEQFKQRYNRSLHWKHEQFQERVTKGCFPLHPITTALLSNLRFQSGTDLGAARTVLGFIFDELKEKQSEPVAVDGRPNWVLPVNLVDYFGARVSEEYFAVFDNACRQLGKEGTDEQWAILQALMLHEAANVGARGDDQVAFLAQAAGLELPAIRVVLEQLREQSIIRYGQRAYSFWPASNNAGDLERRIREKLAKFVYDDLMVVRLNKDVTDAMPGGAFGSKEINVNWGHPADWAIREELLTNDIPLYDRLVEQIQSIRIDHKGIRESSRGHAFWLIARNDAELATLRQTAAQELDRAVGGDHPYPVVLVLPMQPTPHIAEMHRRLCALRSFNSEEQAKVGVEIYTHEVEKTTKELLTEVERLRGGTENAYEVPRIMQNLVVPLAYRGSIATMGSKSSLRSVIQECYRMAYRYCPPAFFTQYRVATQGANKLRISTKTVANLLLHNTTSSLKTSVSSDGVGRDLVERYLMKDWGLVGADQRLQMPTNHRIQAAWNLLDTTFLAGKEIPLRAAFIALLNPPYGYDYNTALLVFAAWFGYNGNDLRVFLNSRQSSQTALSNLFDKGAKDFIEKAAGQFSGALARRKAGENEEEVRKLIFKIQRSLFMQTEAEGALVKLSDFVADMRNNEDLRRDAERAAEDLGTALAAAQEYDAHAKEIDARLKTAPKLRAVVELYTRLKEFPTLSKVKATAPKISEIQEEIRKRAAESVEYICAKNERLADLTQSGLQRQYLVSDRKTVVEAGLSEFAARFDNALKQLEEEAERLKKINQESAIREHIKGMSPDAQLKDLIENCDRLEAMVEYSPPTMNLRDQKLNLMRQKIGQLEQAAKAMLAQYANVDSAKAAQALLRQVLQSIYRYQSTPLETELKQLQGRLEHVSSFLAEVTVVAGTSYASPAEVEKAKATLSELRQRHQAHISGSQLQILDTVEAQVKAAAEDAIQKALGWLRNRSQELDRMKPEELGQKLATVPAFLPEEAWPELEQIRAEVQKRIEAEAERQRRINQESAIREHIKSMSPDALLKDLYENCERLEAMVEYSEPTMNLRNQRLSLLREKIGQLEQAAKAMLAQYANVDSAKSAQAQLRQVLQSGSRYQGTVLETELKQLQGRLESISSYFAEVTTIEGMRCSSPMEAEKAMSALSELRQRHQADLSSKQLQILDDVEGQIKTAAADATKEALDWLRNLTQDLERVKPSELQRRMVTVPAFLPDEARPELGQIQAEVQKRLDTDMIARIEDEFGRIADRKLREECVRRLQQILTEDASIDVQDQTLAFSRAAR